MSDAADIQKIFKKTFDDNSESEAWSEQTSQQQGYRAQNRNSGTKERDVHFSDFPTQQYNIPVILSTVVYIFCDMNGNLELDETRFCLLLLTWLNDKRLRQNTSLTSETWDQHI